jgi:hypothetical protein
MEQFLAALNGAWRVLLLGLLFGAGLPMLFAFGVRALSWGTAGGSGSHEDGVVVKPSPIGRLIAYLMFAMVILLVVSGVGYIVAHGLGWTVTFSPWPVVAPKA